MGHQALNTDVPSMFVMKKLPHRGTPGLQLPSDALNQSAHLQKVDLARPYYNLPCRPRYLNDVFMDLIINDIQQFDIYISLINRKLMLRH